MLKRFAVLVLTALALSLAACGSEPVNYPTAGVFRVGDSLVDYGSNSVDNAVNRIGLVAAGDTATLEVRRGHWKTATSSVVLSPEEVVEIEAGERCDRIYRGDYEDCSLRTMEVLYIPGEGVRWRLLPLDVEEGQL
ncbi:MAG TPA: hypothetical protein VJ837_02575 [Candidatus Paceibacterota bacterium]|nr:hypothetical protein [Candidatus Paceibacterota bacterium]